MSFLKSNWIALLLVFSTLMSEYFHLLFVGMPFNSNVGLDAGIYWLTTAFGGTTLLTSFFIFLLTDKKKVASRAILFGVIGWNVIEVYENICYLAEVNDNVLFINGSAWGQMAFILVVIFGSYYGFTKSKS
jgi:hypothetical protein